ncbi:hypothetical protein BBP40_010650 [Aspergillus hancockii]|nr:hypothetical protein BBP40_010650 [Aspergillus hancockii]
MGLLYALATPPQKSQTQRGTRSVGNGLYIMYVCNLVMELLSVGGITPRDIVILMSYDLQYRNYLMALASIYAQDPALGLK